MDLLERVGDDGALGGHRGLAGDVGEAASILGRGRRLDRLLVLVLVNGCRRASAGGEW